MPSSLLDYSGFIFICLSDDTPLDAAMECMSLISKFSLLKNLGCPIDEFVKNFIRKNITLNKLIDLDSNYLIPLLEMIGYTPIDIDTITDIDGMWRLGIVNTETGRTWIRYSDEKEPVAIMRQLYIEILNDFYASSVNEDK